MAGRDYTWLQAAVKSWSHRTDLGARLPDFVMLAEERMSADLDARGLDSISTLPTIAGAASIVLAPEVIAVRSIGVPNFAPLNYLTPDVFAARHSNGARGAPRDYTVIGDLLHLGPTPDSVFQLRVAARKTVPPLDSAPEGVNWLIARNPSLYLAAAMCEVMTYLRDDAGQALWEGKYQVALGTANSTKETPGDLVVRSDFNTR
jgi:hypothetical protein